MLREAMRSHAVRHHQQDIVVDDSAGPVAHKEFDDHFRHIRNWRNLESELQGRQLNTVRFLNRGLIRAPVHVVATVAVAGLRRQIPQGTNFRRGRIIGWRLSCAMARRLTSTGLSITAHVM
jgi:hypothetical protein